MPCGPNFQHETNWYPSTAEHWYARPGKRYANGCIADIGNWPPPDMPRRLPKPWLVDVVGVDKPISYFVERACRFVEVASDWLYAHPDAIYLTERDRPLLGIPLIGTGTGGAAHRAGDMAAELLPALQKTATQCGVDVALVLIQTAKYAAAVRVRERTLGDDLSAWPVPLDDKEIRALNALVTHARKGQLVLFIGAGVSIGAGLPSWDGMLTQLAINEDIFPPKDPEFRRRFHKLSPLDRARVIKMELQRRGIDIADALGRILHEHPTPSLAHCLLAMLPCDQAVTTNYDNLFEVACAGHGRPVAALPWEAVSEKSRWLLKLHGGLEHPEDLVFTRSDYLRYDERRAALKGIVQAMLMTRQMLFVGFSMNDDNFHRIIDDVRKARIQPTLPPLDNAEPPTNTSPPAPKTAKKFGATLGLRYDPIFELLWGQDLRQISVEDPLQPGTDAPAARRLEVFLDILAQKSASANAHLLDPRFDSVLSQEERRLRSLLQTLIDQADDGVRQTRAWPLIEEFLSTFGANFPIEPPEEEF